MADQDNNSRNDERKLDEMLDSMLAAYSAVDPRPGLQTRILANLKESSAAGRSKWRAAWIWSGAMGTAVALIVLVMYLRQSQPTPGGPPIAHRPVQQVKPDRTTEQAITPHLVKPPVPHPLVAAGHPAQHRAQQLKATVSVRETAAVRQDVFPSPTPLSDQEKLLLRYLTRTPQKELIAQSHVDRPAELEGDDAGAKPDNLTQVHSPNSNTR